MFGVIMDDIVLNFRRELNFSASGKIFKGELNIIKIVFQCALNNSMNIPEDISGWFMKY